MKAAVFHGYPVAMSTLQTPLERTSLRRAVLQVASLQLLALLVLGLLSLFAVWSLDRQQANNLRGLGELARAIDLGRSAQLDVKRQVQAWKNVLLRGSDARQLERYAQDVREAHDHADARLVDLRTRVAGLGLKDLEPRIGASRELHARMTAAYVHGISQLSDHSATMAQVDESVRGVDRPLDEAIDELVRVLDESMQPRIAAMGEASHRRFEALTRVLWFTLAVVSMLVGFGVWRIIGGSRNASA